MSLELSSDGAIESAVVSDVGDAHKRRIMCDSIVLATGGFAGSWDSLRKFAPGTFDASDEAHGWATSNSWTATGEGLGIALKAGAGSADLDQVLTSFRH